MKNKYYTTDLSFICNLCQGLDFKLDITKVLDHDRWEEPNRCKCCHKEYVSSNNVGFGMVYVSPIGKKFLPSQIPASQQHRKISRVMGKKMRQFVEQCQQHYRENCLN